MIKKINPRAAILTALAASAVLLLSCEPSRNGEAVDYGAEASSDDLNKALVAPLADLNLNSLVIGQFVHFSTTDTIAGGQVTQVESDTGQTIVDRTDSTDVVSFSIVQNKYTYSSSAPDKASVEFQLNVERSTKTAPPAADQGVPTGGTAGAAVSATAFLKRLHALQTGESTVAPDLSGRVRAFVSTRLRQASTEAGVRVKATADAPKTTIHNLKTWEAVEAAPDLVQKQTGCLGIPNCQIRVRHITFDQVTWDKPSGTRVQFDLAMSPDVPLLSGYKMTPIFEYYPGLIKSCVTLMIPVGDKGAETLLTQCSQTENFTFVAAPSTTDTPEATQSK